MAHTSATYVWIWGGLVLIVVWLMESPRVWLEMRAVADDETAANLIGLNTTMTKIGAFGVSAAVAAISGGLFAHHHVYIEPGNFGFERSIDFVLAVTLGGCAGGPGAPSGSLPRAVISAMRRFTSHGPRAARGVLRVSLPVGSRHGL